MIDVLDVFDLCEKIGDLFLSGHYLLASASEAGVSRELRSPLLEIQESLKGLVGESNTNMRPYFENNEKIWKAKKGNPKEQARIEKELVAKMQPLVVRYSDLTHRFAEESQTLESKLIQLAESKSELLSTIRWLVGILTFSGMLVAIIGQFAKYEKSDDDKAARRPASMQPAVFSPRKHAV